MDEKTITVNELLDVIKSNFSKNIYADDFKDFCNAIAFGTEQFSVQKIDINGNECLEFIIGTKVKRKVIICKMNEQFFLMSSSALSLRFQEELLKKINFNKIFDYFIKNQVTEEVKIEAFYDGLENNRKSFWLKFNHKELRIRNKDYGLIYELVKEDKNYMFNKSEEYIKSNWECCYESCFELKSLFFTVPDFLDKLKVNFNKLPQYIQEEYNKMKLAKNKENLLIPSEIEVGKEMHEILEKQEIIEQDESIKKKQKVLGLFKKNNN